MIFETGCYLNSAKHSRNFWIGNAVLALAMLMLLFMGPLSNALGIWAAVDSPSMPCTGARKGGAPAKPLSGQGILSATPTSEVMLAGMLGSAVGTLPIAVCSWR